MSLRKKKKIKKEVAKTENQGGFVLDNTEYITTLTKKFLTRKPYIPVDPKKVTAFMPGTIQKIFVKKGDAVKEGHKLLILEAMKMKNELNADIEGTIKDIYVEEGDKVAKNQVLVEFE